MGKRRKTYKEKLISDLRRKVYSLEGLKTASFEPENELEKKNQQANKPLYPAIVLQNPAGRGQSQYPYLLKDIAKTGILTTSIIAVQILLFFILKNHIVMLPWVSY